MSETGQHMISHAVHKWSSTGCTDVEPFCVNTCYPPSNINKDMGRSSNPHHAFTIKLCTDFTEIMHHPQM